MEYNKKKTFCMEATTKEQYLKFKKDIKNRKYKSHAFYTAYYIFKHRIGADPSLEYLVDSLAIEKWLDEVAIPQCRKGLVHGYICGIGGDYRGFPSRVFKNQVIEIYNEYANEYTK